MKDESSWTTLEVKSGIFRGVEISADIGEVVTGTVSFALQEAIAKDAGKGFIAVAEVAADAATGAVDAAAELTGEMGGVSKAIMLGVLRGIKQTPWEASRVIRSTARSVIRNVEQRRGDLGLSSKALVEGAMQGARELDLDLEPPQAASAASQGAYEGAQEISASMLEKVHEALMQNVAKVGN